MSERRIILLEFNELCPLLLDRWMSEGKLPNFRAFHGASQVFLTEADEPAAPYLEPWIQWYSVHTGLAYQQHKVFSLTDGPRAGYDDVWQIIMNHGNPVGNFASMNAAGFTRPGSFFVPDPWCTTEAPYPPELAIYQRVVADRVREYTNPSRSIRASDYLAFSWFMLRHGLSLDTIGGVAAQIGTELVRSGRSWRRASLLDRVQFDVFRHYYQRSRPRFATFFSNSTAHYQHAYWRHMEPELFTEPTPVEERSEYGGAVLFGYQKMDLLLARFMRLADKTGATLVFATALSQQPFLKYEGRGGQHFHRARDIEGLMEFLGVPCQGIQPVMAHEYALHFADEAHRQEGQKILERVTCGGQPVFDFGTALPERTIHIANDFRGVVSDGAVIQVGDGRQLDFHAVFYKIPEIKSGRHHPDGALWFRTGSPATHTEHVSILDILPTILSMLDIPIKDDEPTRLTGRDLSALFVDGHQPITR